ncbi:ECF-type riboflavin transporter substrate-binding protein [Bacillus sp. HMF5848]|uniref:ECF-type riboflavin transporter substrate-binding protein n=1 Tax=Bacillus sp. HMF5848 TaxID=2495421 RepID=UPI000F77A046|nr:ECF-type riboflavin transporter substrate-binding protein [Bacillus sp. HMF5848]RSK25941.1 ECF-type riboflavin transporter substrate-binding protein [Bacillus sp. HMF5848]
MAKNTLSTKTIVAIGIGTAVFVILGRFASIPSGIPNTTIETTYAFLALMAVVFGPVAGGLIGLIGHALKDAIFYGSPWWSWVVVSGIVGLLIGLATRKVNIQDGEFGVKQIIAFNISQAIVQAVGWFLIAPTLDILIYAEPANKVYVQGIVAGVANIVTVGVLGTILLVAYAKTRTKSGSLEKEETISK